MSMVLENKRPPTSLGNTAAMEATCQWFIYAAGRLWENVINKRTYPKVSGAGPGDRLQEEEWEGYTRRRWEIWEGALKDARDACEDERMTKLIDDALASMRRAMANQ